MIAPLLILGTPIGGTDIERVVGPHIGLQPECDPHEPACSGSSSRRGCAGDLRLDHTTRKVDSLDHRERLDLDLLLRCHSAERHADAFLAVEHGRLGHDILQAQPGSGFEGIVLGLLRRQRAR